ncbi:hypothetical protein AcW1_003486 [Taiwanofungus camphoratus]|nr:hypothetical protein AcW1_003486 [Antrodia cinnamomea]KAI0943847.1 hypothetical protein AcV7_001826 [Antrodia cinnamomea]
MTLTLPYSTLVLDLGDVLFSWPSRIKTSIDARTLKNILLSTTRFDDERGRISQAECYERVAASEIADVFRQARECMESNDEMIALLDDLKSRCNEQLHVYAISNISIPNYEYILTKPVDWSNFDKVFPSSLVGERKPHLGIYKSTTL